MCLVLTSPVGCGGESEPPVDGEEYQPLPAVGLGNGEVTVIVEGSEDPVTLVEPLELCEINSLPTVGDPNESWTLDDFDDGDGAIDQNGLRGWWYSFGDGSSGTQTPDPWAPEEGGRAGSPFALHITGSGYSGWGSVNAVTLATQGQDADCLFDASAYDGISFWVKGSMEIDPGNASYVTEQDREVVKVQLHEKRTLPLEAGGTCDPLIGPCWNAYRFRVPLSECWTRYSVSFSDFEQDSWGQEFGELDTSQLYQFALEVNRFHSYDYWIDDVEFFVGEPPETSEDCEELGMGGSGGQE